MSQADRYLPITGYVILTFASAKCAVNGVFKESFIKKTVFIQVLRRIKS